MDNGTRRSAVVLLASLLVCTITPAVCAGQVGAAAQADDAVLHFVGGNLEAEHSVPELATYCSYDLTLGCSLTSDVYGFRTYTVNWMNFRTQLYYVMQLLPYCVACETYFVFLDGDDFDLSSTASEVQLFAKGTFVNPTAEDIYTIRLSL